MMAGLDAACAAAEAGEYSTAVRLFQDAVAAAPEASTYEMLAQCLMEVDDLHEALRAARTAILLDPTVCVPRHHDHPGMNERKSLSPVMAAAQWQPCAALEQWLVLFFLLLATCSYPT